MLLPTPLVPIVTLKSRLSAGSSTVESRSILLKVAEPSAFVMTAARLLKVMVGGGGGGWRGVTQFEAPHEPQPTAQRFIDMLFPQTISPELRS